ncbi:hypothetical protein Q8F55_005153 [Vanrija albida]|uniref:Uncharacterized protein n=1 Tax=Vanrija albida TaxID=181172 RepID=A0ABR3Q0U0_9TREE
MGNVHASITTPAFITRTAAEYATEEHEKTTSACDYLPHADEGNPAVYITKVYWYTPDGRRWCMTREALCSAWINLANRELLYSSIEAYAQNVEVMRPASMRPESEPYPSPVSPVARRLSLSMSPTIVRRILRSLSMSAVTRPGQKEPESESSSRSPASSGTASPAPPEQLGRVEIGRLRGELNNLILYLQNAEERGVPPRKPDAERAATLDDILEFAMSPAPSEVDLAQGWRDKLERVEQTFGDEFSLPPVIEPGFKDDRNWRVRINDVEYAAGDEVPDPFRTSLCSCSVCSI